MVGWLWKTYCDPTLRRPCLLWIEERDYLYYPSSTVFMALTLSSPSFPPSLSVLLSVCFIWGRWQQNYDIRPAPLPLLTLFYMEVSGRALGLATQLRVWGLISEHSAFTSPFVRRCTFVYFMITTTGTRLSVSKTATLLGFSRSTVSPVYQEGSTTQRTSSQNDCGKHWSQHGPASLWNAFEPL